MVISFSSDPAFEFLQEHGFVFTFRASERKISDGRDWANRGRGQEKEFDVFIREVGEVVPSKTVLEKYAPFSGFGEADRWRDEIIELNGELPNTGYLYLALKIPESHNKTGEGGR